MDAGLKLPGEEEDQILLKKVELDGRFKSRVSSRSSNLQSANLYSAKKQMR